MQALFQFLEAEFQLTGWTLTRPEGGHQKECYIAQAGNLKLFIKFGLSDLKPLQRLGEIGVAPRVLATGSVGGKRCVVQEYLAGVNPVPAWFSEHLDYLAAFIRRYHDDKLLSEMLGGGVNLTYQDLIFRDISTLESQLTRLKQRGITGLSGIDASFEKLKLEGTRLQASQLVPVHAEPNTENMLVVDNRLWMIDWDEIRLGDPMQDIGLILWWYVPPLLWARFFESYNLTLDASILNRVFWWTARASLLIAFWQFEHGYDGQAFLLDFQAAVNGQPNPHASF